MGAALTRPRALLIALVLTALVAWHLEWLSGAETAMIVAAGALAAVGWVVWQGRW